MYDEKGGKMMEFKSSISEWIDVFSGNLFLSLFGKVNISQLITELPLSVKLNADTVTKCGSIFAFYEFLCQCRLIVAPLSA